MRSGLRRVGLISLGLALGIGLGLYVGWVAWPTQFTNANPAVLQATYRRDYLLMIAAAYAMDEDLPAARQRVAGLGENSLDFLLDSLLDMILRAEDETEIRQVARLAADLGLYSPAMEPFLPGGLEPTPSAAEAEP